MCYRAETIKLYSTPQKPVNLHTKKQEVTMTKKILLLLIFLCIPLHSAIAKSAYQNLNPEVLKLAEQAYANAKISGLVTNQHLTIVDYSLASTSPRMWVIDMRSGQLKYHIHVAHGMASGLNYATKFSNQPQSRMSSLGIFITRDIYYGNHGVSLNIDGMQKNYNSNARLRRIVLHGANYVDQLAIQKGGRLGRSWGCLALNPKVANDIMHTIKDGSVIFCYYPDKAWLREATRLSAG